MGGNAVSLKTGMGDGEYSVTAEIVDFGESIGECIAAIHIRFIGTEDNEVAKEANRKCWKEKNEKEARKQEKIYTPEEIAAYRCSPCRNVPTG